MKPKIETFEKLLLEGANFDCDDDGWFLETPGGPEIARGATLFDMIEAIPAQNSKNFEEIEVGATFFFLDEEYKKENLVCGRRLSDNYMWRFSFEQEIYV